MATSLSSIKSEVDAVVKEATSLADLADKYAHLVSRLAGAVPGVGPEVQVAVRVLDIIDKALHAAQTLLS